MDEDTLDIVPIKVQEFESARNNLFDFIEGPQAKEFELPKYITEAIKTLLEFTE